MNTLNTRVVLSATVELRGAKPVQHTLCSRLAVSHIFPLEDQQALVRLFLEMQHRVERTLFDEVWRRRGDG